MQLLGLNTWKAIENVQKEGWRMLYRGIKPPLVQAMVSKSLMFGLYNFYDELLVQQVGDQPGLHVLAAGLSGTSEAVLAPFEVRSRRATWMQWCLSCHDVTVMLNERRAIVVAGGLVCL